MKGYCLSELAAIFAEEQAAGAPAAVRKPRECKGSRSGGCWDKQGYSVWTPVIQDQQVGPGQRFEVSALKAQLELSPVALLPFSSSNTVEDDRAAEQGGGVSGSDRNLHYCPFRKIGC